MRTIITIMAIGLLSISTAHSQSTLQLDEKISDFDDVDTFVTWLEEQRNIGDVKVNRSLLLTSHPPKVVVFYFENAIRHKILLAVEPGHGLRLVKPK